MVAAALKKMNAEIVDIDEIHATIIAFAKGDFDRRLKVSDEFNIRDSIVSGINMLGEELETRTISRDYFLNIFHAVSEILLVVDHSGKIRNANQSALFYLEVEEDKITSFSIASFFIGGEDYFQELIHSSGNKSSKYFEFEAKLRSNEGDQFPVRGSISKIFDRDQKHSGYLITMKDVTEIQQKQNDILKAVITAEEKERKRIAFDLHDSLGQELSAIKVYMNNLNPLDDQFAFKLRQCQEMIDHSIQNIQQLSFNLMPKALESGNLIWALKELGKRMPNELQFLLNFNQNQIPVSKSSQLIIYRVLQEFLSNTLKHANASEINVNIITSEDNTSITISDNGSGFDINEVERVNGLDHMKTRLKALNIDYELTSVINKGTQLNLTISHEEN